MNFFSQDKIKNIYNEKFSFIEVAEDDHVFTVTLDRAAKKNALHPHMVNELAFAMQYAKTNKSIWAIVIQAKGNIFCAGADLKAFMGIIEPFESTIEQPKEEVLIGELFNKVFKPVIAKVEGDVYAGGFFFLSGSTFVVASKGIKFGLSEVKRGLYPFQVMASLLKVMPARKVIDWCVRGYNLPVEKAYEFGLVTHLVGENENIDATVQGIVEELKLNSPTAISKGLEAFDHIQSTAADHKYLHKMLMETVKSSDAQEGMKAFKEKRKPNWGIS